MWLLNHKGSRKEYKANLKEIVHTIYFHICSCFPQNSIHYCSQPGRLVYDLQ